MPVARVVTFEGVDKDRMDEMKREMREGERPEGVPATEIVVLHDPELPIDQVFNATGPAVAVWLPGTGVVVPAHWMSLSGRQQLAPDRNTRGYVDKHGSRHWLDVYPDIAGAPGVVALPAGRSGGGAAAIPAGRAPAAHPPAAAVARLTSSLAAATAVTPVLGAIGILVALSLFGVFVRPSRRRRPPASGDGKN